MEVIRALLRFFSYLFHGVLTLFLIAVSGLALAGGSPALQLEMLPWTGSTLIRVVLWGSLFGLLALVLAVRGTLRPLFFLWTMAVALLLVRGYIFSGYRFDTGEFRMALYLIGASLLAVLGAWFQMMRRPVKRRK